MAVIPVAVIPVVVREVKTGQLTLYVLESRVAEFEGKGYIPKWNASSDCEVVLRLEERLISQWDDQEVLRQLRNVPLTSLDLVLSRVSDLIVQARDIQEKALNKFESKKTSTTSTETFEDQHKVNQAFFAGLQLFLEERRDGDFQLWMLPKYNEAYRTLVKRLCEVRLDRGTPQGSGPAGQIDLLKLIIQPDQTTIVDLPYSDKKPPNVAQFREIITRERRRDAKEWDNIILHLAEFTKAIDIEAREAIHLRNLIKATLAMADRGEEIQKTLDQLEPRDIRQLHVFIVRTETDLEDLKEHLNYLLQFEAYPNHEHFTEDLHRACCKQTQDTLEQAIIEHHLQIYNLNAAGRFLKHSRSSLRLKRGLAFLFLHTILCFVMFLILLLLLLFGLEYLATIIEKRWLVAGLETLSLLLVGGGFLLLLWLYRERLIYFQFLLPRLFGAVTVGFTLLVFDSMPWRMGMTMDWIPYGALDVVVYTGSFIYLFLEVQRTRGPFQDVEFKEVWTSALKLFFMAWMEALVIGTVISTLLAPVALQELNFSLLPEGLLITNAPWFSIGISPKLIFFWAGIAMFVGAFAQLLWQDRKLTEPL